MSILRFIHLSDVHVREPRAGWRWRDIASKRATGWVNLVGLGRGRRFQHAAHRLRLITHSLEAIQPDTLVFSGDASTLGFSAEFRRVAGLLDVSRFEQGIAVPGNHDHYTRRSQRDGEFELAFERWMVGRRINGETYPFARSFSGVWFIGVNSSVPNRLMWDSRGFVGRSQLARLEKLLAELPAGPRVLVTHYPYCTAEGIAEPPWHGLRDREALADIACRHEVRLWLSGHRHRPYIIGPNQSRPFAVASAGSATQDHLASFTEYVVNDVSVSARRHTFDAPTNAYVPSGEWLRFDSLFAK